MANWVDCSLASYMNEINQQYGQCLKDHLGGANDIGCIARAALIGVRDISAKCSAVNNGVDCSFKGYLTAVVESIDVESRVVNIGVKKVSKKVVNTIVPQGLGSSTGCLVGGAIGAVGGFYVTRNRLGAQIAAVQGCKWGANIGVKVAETVVGPIQVVVKIGKKIKTFNDVKDALEQHNGACKAKLLTSFDFEAEQLPKVRFEASNYLPVNANHSNIIENPIIAAPHNRISVVAPEEHPVDVQVDDVVLDQIGQQLLDFAGQVSGVAPALEELKKLHGIMVVLAKNPAEGPIKIVSELLKMPEQMVKNVLKGPEDFLKKGELLLKDPSGGCLGALAVCGSILSFMNSATWVANFMRDPKHMALETLKMPFTTVKGVIELGIGLIRHPEKTVISFCKSLIKSPVHTVNGFLRAFGLKKRKKRKAPPQPRPAQPLPVSSQEKARIVKKYLADLTALYGYAKGNWFIDPFKTIEEYHYDLQKDWESGPENRMLCKDFSNFPLFLKAKFEQEDFYTIKRLSPRAHPKETMPPIEVILAYEEIDMSLQKVQRASKLLDAASQAEAAAIQELNIERTQLHNNISQLSTFINNNEDKIKKALRARMNKNKQ